MGRVRLRAVTALSVLAMLTACSAEHATTSDGEPAVDKVALISDFKAFTLPLDAYQPDTTQLSQIMKAEQALAVRCLKRFGFEVKLPASPTGPRMQPNARRYGVTDLTEVQKFGYKLPPSLIPTVRGPKLTPAAESVMMGTGQSTSAGQQVPAGGCLADARRGIEVNPDQYGNDLNFVQALRTEAYDRSRKDSRVEKAIVDWSACMAAAGYHYPDGMSANNDPTFTTTAKATPVEIQTAVTDVQCKKSSNMANIWAAVEVGYQNAAVQKNLQSLTAIRDRLQTTVKTAGSMVAAQS